MPKEVVGYPPNISHSFGGDARFFLLEAYFPDALRQKQKKREKLPQDTVWVSCLLKQSIIMFIFFGIFAVEIAQRFPMSKLVALSSPCNHSCRTMGSPTNGLFGVSSAAEAKVREMELQRKRKLNSARSTGPSKRPRTNAPSRGRSKGHSQERGRGREPQFWCARRNAKS